MLLEFYKKLKGESLRILKDYNHVILFVNKGKILCKSPLLDDYVMEQNQTVLIPINTELSLYILEDADMILFSFSEMPDIRTAEFVSSLKKYISTDLMIGNHPPFVMDMKREFEELFDFLKYISESKWKADQYIHSLLFTGLMFIYETEHSRKENALFFSPLITTKHFFKNQVLANQFKAKSAKDLAVMCNMPYHTFCRLFLLEFRSSPYKWMLQERKKRLRSLLESTDMSMLEIAEELHFCSIAHLSKFCTKYFGESPSSIRKNKRNPIV
ncbi:AraC family transcriptional regulator [Porphyromonas pogonae]|uniref:helix-turn-helix domain-containing protein n=1 Tax=Porphyromonas pogonae TaxID=867595 RepID=UPI002E7A8FA9|nr:AraC family transcriptional regulator [Porphyromonas pogonae]